MKDDNIKVTDKDLAYDERLSSFMRGKMDAGESAAFLEELKKNETLRSRAIAMGYLADAVNGVGEKRDAEVRGALSDIDEPTARRIVDHAIGRKAVVVPLWKRVAKIAAAVAVFVILVLVGYEYYGYSYNRNLATKYQSEFTITQSFERGEESDESVTKELFALNANVINGKDLDATIERLSSLWTISSSSTYNAYTNYAPFIGWNLAIADLKNNDSDGATVVLQKLISISKPGSAINVKSQELLNEIKDPPQPSRSGTHPSPPKGREL